MSGKDDYVTVPVILGSDVANAGTFTVGYPAGYTAGDFSGAAGHYLSLNGQKLQQPQMITLSFGATVVTVTNGSGDTLAAGLKGNLQLEVRGRAAPIIVSPPNGSRQRLHATDLRGLLVDFGSPKALNAAGLVSALAVGATAGSFAISDMATTANGGVLDVPRNVTLQGDAGGANQVVTVSGFDEYDQPMAETITLSGNTIIQGLKAFKRVTGATFPVGGAAAHTMNVGRGDYLGLPVRIKDQLQIIAEQQADTIVNCDIVRIGYQHTATELDAGTLRYIHPGFAGQVQGASIVMEAATTTGGAITYNVNVTAIAGLTNVIANAAPAGTIYADNAVTGDGTEYFLSTDYISVTPAAAINASGGCTGEILVRRTDGKLATGLAKNTKSTATTADVRGTWKPNTPTDGTTSFALHVLASEVYDLGNYQYFV